MQMCALWRVVLVLGVCAATVSADPPPKPEQYILVNLAPGRGWQQSEPHKLQPEQITAIKSALGDRPAARRRIGLGIIFSYLQNPPDAPLDDALRHVLQLAERTNTPVLIQLDGENWWGGRPDLWNWWDPSRPGYDPANRMNVEWTGWGPEHAVKIAWRNWGHQLRVLPPPNLMSPAYRRACRQELTRLVPIVVDWWRRLPDTRKDLLVGVKVGHESSIGVNAWHYPGGNDLLDRPVADDPTTGLTHDDPVSRGVAAIGYAAVKTAGLRSEGALTEQSLVEVVRRHVRTQSRIASRLGVPRDKLFTHVGGWKEGERLYDAAVNEFACPGWSFYRHADDPRRDAGVQRALQACDAPAWAAVEWLYMGPRETDAWRAAIENTLADPRCRCVCIYNWSSIRNDPAVHEAIRQVVAASVPAASRPAPSDTRRPEPIANYHCQTGENPLWDGQRQVVYWTDIPAGRLYRYDTRTGKHAQIYAGEPVGGFTLQKDGSLLLFQVNRVSLLQSDGTTHELITGIDDDMARFNDVIADPRGRVYAGTIGKNSQVGGVYRVETDGTVRNLFKGTGCSNGMGFSPDRKHFYWTCSTTRRIFRFDYDADTGDLTHRRELVRLGKGEGVPDGLAVDAAGTLWSARWDGSAIWRYTPAGKPIDTIRFPVAKVSSMIFGGPSLDELYVTTAGGSPDADTADGTLYRVRVGVRGLPEFRSDVHVAGRSPR